MCLPVDPLPNETDVPTTLMSTHEDAVSARLMPTSDEMWLGLPVVCTCVPEFKYLSTRSKGTRYFESELASSDEVNCESYCLLEIYVDDKLYEV